MYAPPTGRWLSEDPAGYVDGPNQYLYVRNNPTNRVDPSGRIGIRCECFFTGGYAGYQDWVTVDCKGLASACCDAACTAANGSFEGNWEKDPRFTGGIKLCERFVEPGTPCKEAVDACGGQHVYFQFGPVDMNGNPVGGTVGLGFSGGGAGKPPSNEKAFKPSVCVDIKRTNGILKNGPGATKTGKNATDADIQACIAATLTSQAYHWYKYNCKAWAEEAMKACGIST